jgi:hypothetical protein
MMDEQTKKMEEMTTQEKLGVAMFINMSEDDDNEMHLVDISPWLRFRNTNRPYIMAINILVLLALGLQLFKVLPINTWFLVAVNIVVNFVFIPFAAIDMTVTILRHTHYKNVLADMEDHLSKLKRMEEKLNARKNSGSRVKEPTK